jgi:conjugal transfer pilus assembly protein TraF
MWKHLVILALINSLAIANVKENFFDRAKEGWFYYEEPIVSKEHNATDEDKKFIASIPLDNLESLSAKEFRETLDRVRDISVMKPSYENIMAYKRMTKFATDQSEKFAVNYKLASIIDDSYEYHDIGTGGFTNNALKDEREKKELAKHLTENVVFVTFTKDPNGTLTQKQIVSNINMRRDYGVDTRTIALADFPEMEKRLGITNDVENFVYYKKEQKWQRIRRSLIDGDAFVKDFIFYEKNKDNFKLDEELSQ